MTFGVSRDQGLFEWAGTSLSSIFAQKSNIFRPRMWQMIFDIIRFNQFALDLLSHEDESEEDISGANGSTANGSAKPSVKRPKQQSIGEYLDQESYSEAFRNDYLIPMTASVWSTSPDKASLEFPAITLIRFMWNHHLLTTVAARPTWMTITGGSKQYIDAVMADFPKDRIHLRTTVNSLRIQNNDQIRIGNIDGKEEIFDHVILATHGDQAMDIVREIATPQEKDIMSGFKTSKNTASLHSDLSVSQSLVPCDLYFRMVSGLVIEHSSPNTDFRPANANSPNRLVILELHHNFTLANHRSISLPHLLDEPSTTHTRRYLRPSARDAQSATST